MDTITGFDDFYEISSTSFLAAPEPTDNSGSSTVYLTELLTKPEVSASQLLSDSLESLFDSPETSYSDAKLVLSDDREVSFHRCILSARSPFFKTALADAEKEQKSTTPVKLEMRKLATGYPVGFDSVVAVLAYAYSGRVRPPPKGVSECADESCCHVACRPAVDFMVEVLYLAFVFQIPELVTVYQRHLLDVVDKVTIEDTLVILKLANICGKPCKNLFDKCREIIVKSNVDVVSLKKSLPEDVAKQVIDIRKELGLEVSEPEKHVSNIHKALESDDLALVDMLLTEGHTNLDDAYALHFAVAYCDVKTATDLIELDLADVNRRNLRGYTVLHVAAMRKEPTLIALLLTKGANASEMSLDGRTALLIAKQVTKAAECCVLEKGKLSPKGGVCVGILEQPDSKREPFAEDVCPSLAVAAADELKIRLIDLENRVQMAQLFFPMQAQVAMNIAQVHGTSEFMTAPDLYMGPFKFLEMHRSRLTALSRTVELGKRFFPRCSKLLDDVVDSEDLTELALIDEETPEQRQQKRQRYMEIHDSVQTAFSKDNEEYKKSSLSASSSSTSKSSAKKRSNAKLSNRRR